MRKRRKRTPLARLMLKADRALSLHIRALTKAEYGDNCPICTIKRAQANPIQVCFHFISRRRKILRWREDNVVGGCIFCNYEERYYPDLSRAWFIRKFGAEKYLALVDESKLDFKPTIEYLESIINKYASPQAKT